MNECTVARLKAWQNHNADDFECERNEGIKEKEFFCFFSLPFACFHFAVSDLYSKSVGKQAKRTHFSRNFHIVCITMCRAVCVLRRARKFGIRFFFPFYLNKLSYLKRPASSSLRIRALPLLLFLSLPFFLSSFPPIGIARNYEREYSRNRVHLS